MYVPGSCFELSDDACWVILPNLSNPIELGHPSRAFFLFNTVHIYVAPLAQIEGTIHSYLRTMYIPWYVRAYTYVLGGGFLFSEISLDEHVCYLVLAPGTYPYQQGARLCTSHSNMHHRRCNRFLASTRAAPAVPGTHTSLQQ